MDKHYVVKFTRQSNSNLGIRIIEQVNCSVCLWDNNIILLNYTTDFDEVVIIIKKIY